MNKVRKRSPSEYTKAKISKALGIPVRVTDIYNEKVTQSIFKWQAAKALGVWDATIRRYIIL